jgi:hypothetical protein
MKKRTAARFMLCIHLGFAILSIVRWADARHQLKSPLIANSELVFFDHYFLTMAIATWTGLIVSFLFYCFSKFSAVMAISFLSFLYYFWG